MSRREQIRMSQEEMLHFLRSSKTAILTSNSKEGFPHPMPMWFGVEEDASIIFTTFRKSQKVKNLTRDPRTSILVEDGEEYAKLRGVVIHAHAEITDDVEGTIDALLRIGGGDPMAGNLEEREKVRDAVRPTAQKRVLIRCVPERIISWDHGKLGGVY